MRVKLSAALFVAAALCQPAFAQDGRGAGVRTLARGQRVALVIGNADYNGETGRLTNPVNDAADVAAALRRLGFTLVGGRAHLNLDKRRMVEMIRDFGGQLRAGGVGLFYFAGHGVQVDRRNYLLPITDALRFQEDAEFEAVEVEQVLREMERVEDAVNILILDACRNNNLPRKAREARGGLGEPQRKPSGVYIAFAARDGQTAAENPDGRNGLYTQELLKNLETPNLRIEDVFMNTRRAVKRLSNKRQEPIEYGSLDDVFYFKAGTAAADNAGEEPPPAPAPRRRPQPAEEEGPPVPKATPAASPRPRPAQESKTEAVTVGYFAIRLEACRRVGGHVSCELTVNNVSGESRPFNLCHADYRAKRRGLEVTRAWDDRGNDYALAESLLGTRRWAQSSYNQAVLPPRVPVRLALRFDSVAAEADSFRLVKIAFAEETNRVRLSYAEFSNVRITK